MRNGVALSIPGVRMWWRVPNLRLSPVRLYGERNTRAQLKNLWYEREPFKVTDIRRISELVVFRGRTGCA